MNADDPHFGDEEFEKRVRETAYYLWERDGSPAGDEKHYWYQALEKCLSDRELQLRLRNKLVDPM